jgi:amino-acid N-acetyltransferase
MTVRAAWAADYDAVCALLKAAALPVGGLDDHFPGGYAVGVDERGAIVGACGIETYRTAGLLRSAVVAEQVRGSGLGGRLVEERLDWARRRGLDAVFLLTTTAPAFFARLGFAAVERDEVPPAVRASREFAEICPASAQAMVLRLAD